MSPIEPVPLALSVLPPLDINAQGWCPQALHLPSPNCDARSSPEHIELLVIHNISLPPGQFGGPWIADLFTNSLDAAADPYFAQLQSLRVSAHFLIRRDGQLLQFVSTWQRAWHAGVSSFDGREQCNDFSIGIELEGTDTLPFCSEQYVTLCQLTQALRRAHPLRAVTGHQHIAPGRKTDPGPCFDWDLYQSQWASGFAVDAPKQSPEFTLDFVLREQISADIASKKTP
jgi:AmpD protein